MKTQLELIQEAYTGIITEGKEPKFKVGDKVGMGSFMSSAGYQPTDTGTVTKVNKFGVHTVESDNRKSYDDNTKPYQEQFDYAGKTRKEGGGTVIIPVDAHNQHIQDIKDRNARRADMAAIANHIDAKRNGLGEYGKFDSSTAEHLKSLIDKHTNQK